MEVLILNKNYEQVGLLETFESLIWDERFYESGAFEIYCIATPEARKLLRIGNRVQRIDVDTMIGVIDTVAEQNDDDGIPHIVASGRDALYLLNRRIVLEYKQYKETNLRTIAKNLIANNVTATSNTARTIPRIRYVDKRVDPAYITGQYRGETVHDALSGMCKTTDTGIRARLNENDNYVEVSLYNSANRTENQTENHPVILSLDFGTLNDAEWTNSKSGYANIAYVAGEDTGASRVIVSTSNGARGENRYEMFVDARDQQSGEDEDGNTLSAAEYKELLRNRGREALSEIEYGRTFDSTMSDIYQYRKDYNIGDLATVHFSGISGTVRITGVVETFDGEGVSFDPTLEVASWWYDDEIVDGNFLLDEYGDILTDENDEALEDE